MATIQSFIFVAITFPIYVGGPLLGGLFALWGTRKYSDQLIGLLALVALALVGIVFLPTVGGSKYFVQISASLNWAALVGTVFLELVPPRRNIASIRTACWMVGVSSPLIFLVVGYWFSY